MLLCPSVMCIDFNNLKTKISELEDAGVDIFHCDVMDGHFVKNMALGLEDLYFLRKNIKTKMDIHLMIDNPMSLIDLFINVSPDIIYIHPESESFPSKTLETIKRAGISAGLAINPDTSIATIEEILPYSDYVLAMSVNPGFAGQTFLNNCDRKIKKLCEMKINYGYKLIMDGACSFEVIERYSALGVDGFVLGTSTLFAKGSSNYKDAVNKIRTK